MPRFRLRAKLIRRYEKAWLNRAESAIARYMLDINDPVEDATDALVEEKLNTLKENRYLFRARYRSRRDRITLFLEEMGIWRETPQDDSAAARIDDSSEVPWINDDDFRLRFRVSRHSFHALHDLIKDHPVFAKGRRGPRQFPTELQLLIFLKFVGMSGDGNSNKQMRDSFPVSAGMIDKAKERVLKAILALRNLTITWPDEEERQQIADRIEREYGWPNMVFIADGTLFPLATKPTTEDAADYKGRKLGYTINAMILCDDLRRIRAYLAGNPGTCHDERAFKQMPIAKNPEDFLSPTQYGLCDSAFDPRRFMLPAYKKPVGNPVPIEHQVFNDMLSKVRVISEHVNGILKNRFRMLNALPFVLEDRKSLKKILQYIDACIILHNLLVGIKDDIPAEWYEDIEELSDIDNCSVLSDSDELNQPIPEGRTADTRRTQLMLYFNEKTAH